MATAPLDVALAYFDAWSHGDLDAAMAYIDPDIVCDAPPGRLEGAEAYRAFMTPFVSMLVSASIIAAFGDDEKALVMYDTVTRPVAGRAGRGVRDGGRRADHAQQVPVRPRTRSTPRARRPPAR